MDVTHYDGVYAFFNNDRQVKVYSMNNSVYEKLLSIFLHRCIFQTKMEFTKALTEKLCCQNIKGKSLIHYNSVSTYVVRSNIIGKLAN